MALGRRVRGVETEAPTPQPPGSQAAVADEVSKLAETEARVSRLLMEDDVAERRKQEAPPEQVTGEIDEAAAERAAIQAYEREQAALGRPVEELTDEERAQLEEDALRQEFEQERLRDAAEAERMAPEDREGEEITVPPAPAPVAAPVVEPVGEEAPPEPEVFYHGTQRGEFPVFDPTIGFTAGSWFTKDKNEAEKIGPARAFTVDIKSPASMQDFLEARKEIVAQGLDIMEDRQAFNAAVIENLEAKGFDGIRDKNFKGAGGVGEDVVAAFKPEQITPLEEVTAITGGFKELASVVAEANKIKLFEESKKELETFIAKQLIQGKILPNLAITIDINQQGYLIKTSD
jgi:hypothetical protein